MASGTVNSVMHSFPGAQFFLLDYGKQSTRHAVHHAGGSADVKLVNIRFSKQFWLKNNVARLLVVAALLRLLPAKWREAVVSRDPSLRILDKADLVVSIAGGDSFSDIYGLGRLIYVSLPQLLALLLQKRLIQLPQTIGPFNGMTAQVLARFILRRSWKVYARDADSLELVKQLLDDRAQQAEFAYDMAFALEPVILPNCAARTFVERQAEPLVGVNVSGLLSVGGYTNDNMFGLTGDYKTVMRAILRFFLDTAKCRVLLIPHAYLPNDASESDAIACKELVQEMGLQYGARLAYAGEGYNEAETKYLIGRCEFFVGSRMHACIAALSQAVPAVGLAYSSKFRGVWRTLRLDDLVVDLRSVDTDEAVAQVAKRYAERQRIHEQLMAAIPGVRHSVLGLFSRFAATSLSGAKKKTERK